MVMTESKQFLNIVFQRVYRETFLRGPRILYHIDFTAQIYFGYTLSTNPSGQLISNAQLAYFTY